MTSMRYYGGVEGPTPPVTSATSAAGSWRLSDYMQSKSATAWPPVTYTTGQGTSRGIFGYGNNGANVSITNSVTNTAVVESDVTSANATPDRQGVAGTTYGGDKGIFAFGTTGSNSARTNLVSNTGVVQSNVLGLGTARSFLAAAPYGTTGQAIIAFGFTTVVVSISNLISNVGVVAADTAGVGTIRQYLAAAPYGTTGQCVFGYGANAGFTTAYSASNKVSAAGVVAADTTGVGTVRWGLAAAPYGTTGQAIFGFGGVVGGTQVSVTNLVTSAGAFAADVAGVGTARVGLAATPYGNNRAIFAYGANTGSGSLNIVNLISSTGVVATDTTGVGTARNALAGAGFAY